MTFGSDYAMMQGCSYTCLVIGASGSTIYAVSSDDRLKALEEDGSVGLRVASDIETGCAIHQIALAAGGLSDFAAEELICAVQN